MDDRYQLEVSERIWDKVRAGILAYNWTARHVATTNTVIITFRTRAGYQRGLEIWERLTQW